MTDAAAHRSCVVDTDGLHCIVNTSGNLKEILLVGGHATLYFYIAEKPKSMIIRASATRTQTPSLPFDGYWSIMILRRYQNTENNR
jgi:hypothetical protein